MRRVCILGLALCSMGAVPTQQVTWVQPNVAPARAQVLIYRLTITEEGNPTPRVVGLTNVLCGGAANAAECSTVLPVNGQSAIVTGNSSTLRATDPETGAAGPSSAEFVGNQGCIFRDNLYKIGDRAQAQTRRQDMSNLLNEFQAAKFDHVSTTNLKGNQYLVIEECTGKIQPNAAVSRALKTSEEVKENK